MVALLTNMEKNKIKHVCSLKFLAIIHILTFWDKGRSLQACFGGILLQDDTSWDVLEVTPQEISLGYDLQKDNDLKNTATKCYKNIWKPLNFKSSFIILAF